MSAMYRSNIMRNIKPSTNMNNGKDVILVWDILELILILYHDARSLSIRQGQIKYYVVHFI
jgi:hypothetical protein